MTDRTPTGLSRPDCQLKRPARLHRRSRWRGWIANCAWLSPLALCSAGFAWPSGPVHAQAVSSPNIFHRPTATSAGVGFAGPVSLVSHGGPVMTSFTAYLIFWLPAGTHFSSPVSDANYEQVIEQYFQDVGGSQFYNIVTQYPGSNGSPANAVTLGGSVVDGSPYPHAGTTADPLLNEDIVNEVTSIILAQSWPTGLGTMYFVFTGSGIESCFDASHTFCTPSQYCAYHSYFTLNSDVVVYANMADRHSTCLPIAVDITGDPAADTEVSLISHEHIEAVTDPVFNGWFDGMGLEIADKCQFNFGFGDVTTPNAILNGHPYRLQLEWSNVANGCALGLSCPLSPAANCRAAASSSLLLQNPPDVTRRAVKWTWSKGPATSIPEFGDPTSTTSYGLCIYDGANLALDVEVPDGELCGTQPCWSAVSTGYKFRNNGGVFSGIRTIALKASAASRARITFRGKRGVPMPVLGLSGGPVTVQLVNTGSPVCFEASYSGTDIAVNESTKFKARHR